MEINLADTIRKLDPESEHEDLVSWSEPDCGYRGIIAIHSTALGPAVGGTRFWNYSSEELASMDALLLSRAMSYKCALAGLPFGGGKSVIIGDNHTSDRAPLFEAHGRFVESLHGRYITAEDVGTTPADMEFVRRETKHVAGLPGRSGNPSPKTALGVFRALQACAKHRWDSDSLAGRTVAIQGCGSTGYYLAQQVRQAGAKLIVSDLDPARTRRVVDEFAAVVVAPDEIFGARADVFAPCALGGIINDTTIPQLQVEIIVGSANNHLLDDSHGEALASRGILYAPDYVANSGGLYSGCRELLGWDESQTNQRIDEIYHRMLMIIELSKREEVPPFRTAHRLARSLIAWERVIRL